MEAPQAASQSPGSQLSKKLTLFNFFSIGFGAIIGVGWAVTIGDWLDLGGGPLPVMLAFVCGALLLLPVCKVYGELSSQQHLAGGALIFVEQAFGRTVGFVTGWFLALGYIMLCPWEVIAIGKIIESLFPSLCTIPLYTVGSHTIYLPTLLISMVITAVIGFGNFLGVEKVAKFQNVLVCGLIFVASLAVITSMLSGIHIAELLRIAPTGANPTGKFWTGFFAVLTITPFYFAGFDTIPQQAEEYRAPDDHKGISRMVILSLLSAMVFYLLIIISVSSTMPWNELLQYNMPSAAAYEYGLGMPAVGRIIIVGALCGLMSALNSFFMSGARVLLAMGREKMLPESLAQIHPKRHTPFAANTVVAIITIAGVFLGKGFLLPLTNICSFSFVLTWFLISAASWKLLPHTASKKLTAHQKLLYPVAVCGSGILLLLLLLPWSAGALTRMEWMIVLGWLVLGLAMVGVTKRRAPTLLESKKS